MSSGVTTSGLLATLHHQAAPFALPITGAELEESYRQAGAWWWRVPYVASLCTLAALLHGATGRRRARLLGALAAVGVLLPVAVAAALLVIGLTGA